MKVLILTNVPSPYRVEFFNQLALQCDLTVLYQKEVSSERNSQWKATVNDSYTSVFMKGISTGVDNAFCPEVVEYFKDASFDVRIICGIASPTEMLAILFCRLHRLSYCIEGDGAFAKSGHGAKERLKKFLISGGSMFFSTCEEHDKYYLQYGARKSRIIRYSFSSVKNADVLPKPFCTEEKAGIRKTLNIKENKMVLAVGQFIPRKGFDILLKASVGLEKDIGIYIVGDEPGEDFRRFVRENGLQENVHFAGFQTKEALKPYYYAADVFVLPTREDIWGLVVNEAMACGLPVITTLQCNAGLELIDEGVNGCLIPADEIEPLRDAMISTLQKSESMSEAAINKAKEHTIEKMVDDHVRALGL